MKITGVLVTPFPLTGVLAGHPAFRRQAVSLMPGIAPARPEPNPAMTTLSQSFCAHRVLPKENREEYDKHSPLTDRFTQIVATPPEQKKEEDDPFGSGGRRQEDEPFRPAEEVSFQSGVEMSLVFSPKRSPCALG